MPVGGIFFFVLPPEVEKRLNVTFHPPPYAARPRAAQLHKGLRVADLHADSLLWNRDLLRRGTRGHVDVPRLVEGNVALQAFTIVTQVPRGLNLESNEGETDNITLLAIAQRWPVASWGSLKERALYQARKLREAVARSGGRLNLITSKGELSRYLERRGREPNITAGFLGVEGAHVLEGELENINVLFDHGIRMMAPTHFFDNEIGGSAHGRRKGGLTPFGREMIKRMEAKGMILDLAHASPQAINDALQIATRTVVVSHTGVKGTCDNNRNLSNEQLKAVARTGGIVGIGFWEAAVCNRDARSIARSIRYTADLIGVEHVALGSDYDGAVGVPFDVSGMVQLTDALIEESFNDEEIKLIMGENVLRVLMTSLSE